MNLGGNIKNFCHANINLFVVGNQVVSIIMHEGDTYKWLKAPQFDFAKMTSPKDRTIHCVFHDKTISLGKLEEWVFESEFLWLVKCHASRQVQDTFIRQGRVNYLLVDAPAAVSEASDVSEYVLANIVVRVSQNCCRNPSLMNILLRLMTDPTQINPSI